MNRPDWVTYGLDIATVVASRSEDPFRKVGAVIMRADHSIAATGYNGAPRGMDLDWSNRAERRMWVIHAEMNALAYVTRHDFWTDSGILLCTHQPCEKCMPMLAAHNIHIVFYREKYVNPEMGEMAQPLLASMASNLGMQLHKVS